MSLLSEWSDSKKCDECKEHDSENIVNYNDVPNYLCYDCYNEHLKWMDKQDEELKQVKGV